MGLIAEIRRRARHVIGPALGLLIIGYFAYHVVHGERGLLAWHHLDQRVAQTKAELAAVQAKRRTLEHRVRLLRPESLDADLLEESVRRTLGYGRPDEVVIMTTPALAR